MDQQTILTIQKATAVPVGDRSRPVRRIGLALTVAALVTVVVSFAILTGMTRIVPTAKTVYATYVVNGIFMCLLLGLIGFELVGLWRAWAAGRAAARLHLRVIGAFTAVAAAPALLVAVLASITLDRGLDRWFEERTRLIVDSAAMVGNAYLSEHARAIRSDAIAMATDVARARELYDTEPDRFDGVMVAQAQVRGLPAAFILEKDGTVLTRTVIVSDWAEIQMPPPEAFAQADDGEPVVITPGQTNQVGVIIKLEGWNEQFLYITRPLDPKVLGPLRQAKEAVADYRQLDQTRFGSQLAFAMIFVGVSLIFMIAAIWIGIGFANRLVSPIRRLILAADYVSKGHLAVQVPVRKKEGDLAHLAETFNTMTNELRGQRAELIAAKDQIDSRRRFTEAVLSGVTAGVLGVDASGRITLVNRSAEKLLATIEEDLMGRRLVEAVPEVAVILEEALDEPTTAIHQGQVSLLRAGRELTVNVRITSEASDPAGRRFVVTLDDITDLVSAQRSSAWADVARRIAHEIKNPLTPIQLSAERLRRRYGKVVADDHEVFDRCIDTIIRQVGDIERMVNEFSSFARMPKPQLVRADLVEALREAVFLRSVAAADVDFVTRLPDEPIWGQYDHRLLLQAFANLVKNACEAIEAVPDDQRGRGTVEAAIRRDGEMVVVEVIDNGIGLPSENRHRLLEPYVTTREKGTGLGLAIVRKILEDHGGRIELVDAPAVAHGGRGAMVRLTLPAEPETARDAVPLPEMPPPEVAPSGEAADGAGAAAPPDPPPDGLDASTQSDIATTTTKTK